ncbi:MAG: hypothetical protein ABJF50_08435 [Paracoccaceae bacterium]
MCNESSRSDIVQLRGSNDQRRAKSVLAVGDPDEWHRQGHVFPPNNMPFITFKEVTEATLEQYKPELIISPVLALEFDCIELTLLLRNLGYKGEYRAVAQDMPKPALIEREVSQLYPDLKFKIEIQK